ncbi:MAG: pyruvate, phosphate dikinase [Deltaproteobacteria bacterium]|nr:pyruvate, phosphate dikinase [Deltaproteobacteria bacterium]
MTDTAARALAYVQPFETGRAQDRALLGGKGANLAEMMRIGLPVPPGFTLTTRACNAYQAAGRALPEGLWPQVLCELDALQSKMGKTLGDPDDPLLVSVRSGAAVSMPGMMDTVLNLGLNRRSVVGLARRTGDERFAWDCLRRFVQMFSNVVLGLDMHAFELRLEAARRRAGVQTDAELSAEVLRALVDDYEAEVRRQSGAPFPDDPLAQLKAAVCAVFDSWGNARAVIYRQLHQIADDLGTAVNIQAMVFGNMGGDSATGVAFTRDPNTGEARFFGEFLVNAQGEDVVAGIRTPQPIALLGSAMPAAYEQLRDTCALLERHYADMQDIEFTIERGRLFMLQCRSGKRAPGAAIRIAVDLADEGKITRAQALLRVNCDDLTRSMHTRLGPFPASQQLVRGQPASPGAAVGRVVFHPEKAVQFKAAGETVVLMRPETTPDDIAGMVASVGFVTSRGGTTCHAAIVARGMGKPCVVGCEGLAIDLQTGIALCGDRQVREGDVVSLDGGEGVVAWGEAPVVFAAPTAQFATLLGWADDVRGLKVRANADNPPDARRARGLGAEGIGLCRTEHMFGQGGHHPERMAAVQRMIVADTREERVAALADLKPMQRDDFVGIFEAMDGLPVTIRLLDPPLHEFLPTDDQVAALQATDAATAHRLRRKKAQLHETNPMLGFRGVRLGIVFPEIYRMQVEAIFEAADHAASRGVAVRPEIMIPLVGDVAELRLMRDMVIEVAADLGVHVPYLVGTMIEVPRAALVAEALAGPAEFFSFGTNDLTQTTWGYSRDDAEVGFLAHYLTHKVLAENPFVALDQAGVGQLVKMACEGGRRGRPGLKLGICGEHGGEPSSIAFCASLGLDYVSCSPLRVPVARLAAAHAALRAAGQHASASAV